MVDGLPPELTSEQREKVRDLLTQHYRRPQRRAHAVSGAYYRHRRPQTHTATAAQTTVPAPNLYCTYPANTSTRDPYGL